jgi:death-on-curing protein
MTTIYLSIEQVLGFHEELLEAFGGSSGIRDRGGLESALARPAMTFGGDDLYGDLAAKAGALMHSLVLNHPFLDGNKRIGAAAAEFFLECNGSSLEATDDEFEALTLQVAEGKIAAEALAIWFRQRLRTSNV